MILNSDCYDSIGSNHKHNDDYALNGTVDKQYVEWAAISDGCSNSKFTNVGSKILLLASIEPVYYALDEINLFQKDVLHIAKSTKDYLSLPNEALDATLLHIAINNDNSTKNYKKYVINAYGDGSIIKIKNDGNIEFTYIEYPSGAPLYMNYYSNPERFKSFKDKYGVQRKIYKYTFTDNIVTDFKVDIDDNGERYSETGICDDYKVIMVTSDGISSFIGTDKKPIEITILVRALCDFKGFKGEFLQRRMNGFNLFCEKQGWKHTDDFSIAGIHINNA